MGNSIDDIRFMVLAPQSTILRGDRYMKKYTSLTRAFLRDRARNDLAYIGNFWSELASTMLYVTTFILFVQLLFSRIGSMGGYSKDEFLFMTLIGQFTFYVWSIILFPTATQLVANVRSGAFDFVLLRPISAKYFTVISAIRPVYGLFISVPNIILFCWIIDWSSISVTLINAIIGIVIWCCAMVILATIMLLLALPVFIQGDATDMINMSYSLFSITEMPYNLLPTGLKYASFTLLPTLLATAGTAYVMLGKGSANGVMLVGALIAAILSVSFFNLIWSKALRSYSSASS